MWASKPCMLLETAASTFRSNESSTTRLKDTAPITFCLSRQSKKRLVPLWNQCFQPPTFRNLFLQMRFSRSRNSFKASESGARLGVRNGLLQGKDDRGRARERTVWIRTTSPEVMEAAIKHGMTTFVHDSKTTEIFDLLGAQNKDLQRRVVFVNWDQDWTMDAGQHDGVAWLEVCGKENLEDLRKIVSCGLDVVVRFVDWQVIPAEQLVAEFQGSASQIMVHASSATQARVLLEALDYGVNGIVLATESEEEVRAMKVVLDALADKGTSKLPMVPAVISRVEAVGMGDRVCVDLCSLLQPGEGLLVGSFARALFLVHSECLQCEYIPSRPFRVNAGPVHSYVAAPGGRTAYLAELSSGSEVLVVDSSGHCRAAIVGRAKIESRPLVLIEAEVEDGRGVKQSIFLQNAETVRLVAAAPSAASHLRAAAGQPVSVSELRVGDRVLIVLQSEGARHTGIAIEEFILEK